MKSKAFILTVLTVFALQSPMYACGKQKNKEVTKQERHHVKGKKDRTKRRKRLTQRLKKLERRLVALEKKDS